MPAPKEASGVERPSFPAEMLSALSEVGAEFLIGGAHAMAAHGLPWTSKGLWVTSVVSTRVIRVGPDGEARVLIEDHDTARLATVEEVSAVFDGRFVQLEPERGQHCALPDDRPRGQTQRALHVAFESFDPDPTRLAAAVTRRDEDIGGGRRRRRSPRHVRRRPHGLRLRHERPRNAVGRAGGRQRPHRGRGLGRGPYCPGHDDRHSPPARLGGQSTTREVRHARARAAPRPRALEGAGQVPGRLPRARPTPAATSS